MRAGVVLLSWYEDGKAYWRDLRADAMELTISEETRQVSYVTPASTNYKIKAYQTFWCLGFLNCFTNSTTLYMNLSYSVIYNNSAKSCMIR